MKEEKRERLVAGGVALSVVLLFVLVAVSIYQLISINVKKKQIKALETEISRLEEDIDEKQGEIDTWLKEWRIEERARQIGFINGKNK